jgi:hypothetical protein
LPFADYEQNLITVINDYLDNFVGMSGKPGIATGLSPTPGEFMVTQAQKYTVDPSLVIGICRSESSLSTNPNLNGGKYNIYGNSLHFSVYAGSKKATGFAQYTDYAQPTIDCFDMLQQQYINKTIISTDSIYKIYEGEASWKQNVPMIKGTQAKLFGNPLDNTYKFPDSRKKSLETAASAIQAKQAKAAGGK